LCKQPTNKVVEVIYRAHQAWLYTGYVRCHHAVSKGIAPSLSPQFPRSRVVASDRKWLANLKHLKVVCQVRIQPSRSTKRKGRTS
ncbi:MAG TPA: hypothetical protein VM553_22645, partial [Dongiaceae bacterium]|nr:hypothetical protein [Dongiaceae bacterium]